MAPFKIIDAKTKPVKVRPARVAKVSSIGQRPNPGPYVNVLRSQFHLDNKQDLVQGEAYFRGGQRNSKNTCQFRYVDGEPPLITLPLPPDGVSFDYQVRTNVIDTYGGQVIQVLGVSIENLVISGYFSWEGMWGYSENKPPGPVAGKMGGPFYDSRLRHVDNRRNWIENNGNLRNGLVQFSEWFQRYFDDITQQGNYQKDNMTFYYNHRNWIWNIRPYDFPQVRFANDELIPRWEIKCDFIEDMQGNFIQSVNQSVKTQLKKFKDKVGFSEFIEWSEPIYRDKADLNNAIKEIAQDYGSKFLNNFDEGEVRTLLSRGFSFPQIGSTRFLENPFNRGTTKIAINERFK